MFGAICGDILGSTYEFDEKKYEDISEIKLCQGKETFTDDSALTFAVTDWLLNDIGECYYDGEIPKDILEFCLSKVPTAQQVMVEEFYNRAIKPRGKKSLFEMLI